MKPIESISNAIDRIPVLIRVRGEQSFDGAEPDSTELTTEGLLCMTAEGFLLSYEESELTGMAGTTTAFEVQGERVILSRSGRVSSQMVFEEGKKNASLYETPYGVMSMDILTRELRHDMTEEGGTLDICYGITIQRSMCGQNRFHITVRKR